MNSLGIYTLANDMVYDQLIALLNSIKVNVDPDIPVCIIPFDNRLELVKREVAARSNVTLFDDLSSIARWEDFSHKFVAAHPEAKRTMRKHSRWYQGKLHRKFSAFDGPFDKFVFFDADSLAMKPVTDVFTRLDSNDFVFDDWEHKKSKTQAALNIELIEETTSLTESDIRSKLHCSSFFGSKRGIFGKEELDTLLEFITNQDEGAWVSDQGWWDDAFLFNYMTLRSNRSLFNFTLSSNGKERTGNCANSDPFLNIDQVLYNQEGSKPIHRIHYMGYSSIDFKRLCQGEDVSIQYKDIFLHYRFLERPEKRSIVLKPPSKITKVNRFLRKVAKKIPELASAI